MKRNPRALMLFFALLAFLWTAPGIARANTVTVNCSGKGKIQTITAALASLPAKEPNTILVQGTCNENVNITTIDHLTITGDSTTVLNALDPNTATITVLDSQDLTLNNLVINGSTNVDGVDCWDGTVCRLNNVTIQHAGIDGLEAGSRSSLVVTDCQIQNNGGLGIWVGEGSHLLVLGTTIQSNALDGISIGMGAVVHLDVDSANLGNTIRNNLGNGISSFRGTVQITYTANSTISGNSGDGVMLQGASAANIGAVTIINNQGHGIRIGDLSFARFAHGGSFVNSNSTPPNILCDSAYSATRGVKPTATDTNCPVEVQPLP